MKSNKGVTIISAILTTMLVIVIMFIAYEIIYVDLFDLFGNNEEPSKLANITTKPGETIENVEKSNLNITHTTPTTNNNLYRK